MSRFSCLALCLVMLAAAGSHTAQAVTLGEFLTDDTYALFREKALSTTACLTDPAVTGEQFDLDLCPSLLTALETLNAGATEVSAECEAPCAGTFATLSPECFNQLVDAFEADSAPIGAVGSAFLAECSAGGSSSAPAPAPAEAPSTGNRRFGRRL